MSHASTIKVLRERLAEVDKEALFLRETIHKALMAEAREKFTCPCVRLNSDLGIGTCAQQAEKHRVGLQLGYVADTLSALKDCPLCDGTGEPGKKGSDQ